MSTSPARIVIIGAGQAGGQAAYSLRLGGFVGAITIIGDEPQPPYQRPPLSKAYLKGELDADRLFLKPVEYYPEHGVDLLTGVAATRIDLDARTVELSSGAARCSLLAASCVRLIPRLSGPCLMHGARFLRRPPPPCTRPSSGATGC
jgi:NADPH-dependent 2,4-dienoyl-CoA reductase/sulfur reductase-like enzyme